MVALLANKETHYQKKMSFELICDPNQQICNFNATLECKDDNLLDKSSACLQNDYEPDCGNEGWSKAFGAWCIINCFLGIIGNLFVFITFSSRRRGKL